VAERVLVPAEPGARCVASLFVVDPAARGLCGRPAPYLTDTYRVPVCRVHHPALAADRIIRLRALRRRYKQNSRARASGAAAGPTFGSRPAKREAESVDGSEPKPIARSAATGRRKMLPGTAYGAPGPAPTAGIQSARNVAGDARVETDRLVGSSHRDVTLGVESNPSFSPAPGECVDREVARGSSLAVGSSPGDGGLRGDR
jgi:hypothetical protein